ncbi:MAG: AMP-binding protein, partial [bacterium]|nr:AMP-binding protein [bacterium]
TRIRKLYTILEIRHMYGPTQNTTLSTYYPVRRNHAQRLPIGKPLANSTVYLIDKYGHLTPPGVPGEIQVGGAGIARGYLNQPELTYEKFTKTNNSFPPNNQYPITNNHLYRTGDLGRWLLDGNIEFLGRIDHQIKIRGFRIETGEIENRLLSHPDINEVAVIARQSEDGENFLCAYYEAGSAADPAPGLKDFLSKSLPDYMIPTFFIKLEKIPLTSNGKIDRKSLSENQISPLQSQTYTAPRNETEKKLTAIWTEILKLHKTRISIDEDFFNIGGHSLRATTMAARIHKEFNVKLPLGEIFKNATIRALSGILKEYTKEKFATINPAEKKEYYHLSSAQKRLYVLQQMELESTVYNMPSTTPLGGRVNLERLEIICRKLIQRHESLRTSFHMIDENPVQKVHPTVPFKIERLSALSGGSDSAPKTGANPVFFRPFDISKAPLLRVGIIEKTGTDNTLQEHYMQLDMHHIITDGTSQEILIKELFVLYTGKELAPLNIQYRDYAEWQNSTEKKELVKQQEQYWLDQYSGELPVLNLPTDYVRPLNQRFEGSNIAFEINKEETANLKTTAKKNGTTLYMTILSIFTILLAKLSGQQDIIVGTPTAGRNHADIENIIGMFVNTLAMRNKPDDKTTIEEYIREVKENTLKAFENQEYQFEDLVDKLSVKRDTGRNPIFDVMFNLLNQAHNQKQTLSTTSTTSTASMFAIMPESDANSADGHNTPGAVGTSKFDLTLTGLDTEDSLTFHFEYCTKLFKKDTIKRFITYFKGILQVVHNNPELKIKDIEIITEEEKKRILYEFNATATDYPRDKTIQQLFEEQVEKNPDRISTVGKKKTKEHLSQMEATTSIPSFPSIQSIPSTHEASLQESQSRQTHAVTYRELNEKSNTLAYILQSKGVKPGTIVAIIAERSIEMRIGLLGILKAGSAYLPIEPDCPEERINYM